MTDKILKFSASWCQPCKMLSDVLDGHDLGIPVENVDIDATRGLAIQYGIRSVPTLVYVRSDTEISRVSGMMKLADVKKWISTVCS